MTVERPGWREACAVTRAITSCDRTVCTCPFVAAVSACAVSASSTSATIEICGLLIAALTASTVDTTVASPESSASRMMTDFAAPRFARARSLGFVGSPLRVTILSLPRLLVRERIWSSISTRSLLAKITTDAPRMFEFAIASSLMMGKMRFDQPRMSVWFLLMTALLPDLRLSTTP